MASKLPRTSPFSRPNRPAIPKRRPVAGLVPAVAGSGVAAEFAVHPLEALVVDFRLRVAFRLVVQLAGIGAGPWPDDASGLLDTGARLPERRGRYVVGRRGQFLEL